MTPNDILCPVCGTVCGKRYPSTWDEPGFCEGVGENFVLGMVWHCSQSCLDQAKREDSMESVRSIAERTGVADEVRKLLRYDLVKIDCGYDGFDHIMENSEDGDYVTWEDYEKLRLQLDEAQAVISQRNAELSARWKEMAQQNGELAILRESEAHRKEMILKKGK